jgi:hypothetical protein
MSSPIWNVQDLIIDTSRSLYQSGQTYDIELIYDDISITTHHFKVVELQNEEPTLTRSINTESTTQSKSQAKEIPKWIDVIFQAYLDEEITQDDLIQALQFLIKSGIITV